MRQVKWTPEKVKSYLAAHFPTLSLVKYTSTRKPMTLRCSKCGATFEKSIAALQRNVKHGTCGCSICLRNEINRKHTKTREQYKKELYESNPKIELIGEYINNYTPTEFRCRVCNHTWKTKPSHVLADGTGCSKCDGKKKHDMYSMSQSEFVSRVKQANEDLEVIGEYYNSFTPVKVRCLLCGKEFTFTPQTLSQGGKCPFCQSSVSKGEMMVESILDEFGIEYVRQKTFDKMICKSKLRLDFYLPEFNMAIEVDGRQHYMPVEVFGGQDEFEKTILRDKIKNEYCSTYGIPLLRIPFFICTYDEVKDQITSFMRENGVFVYEE